jgi:oxalyl-CoA decarboxylase
MSSVRTEKEATTTLSEALKSAKTRDADGDAVVRALKSVTEDNAPEGETIDGFHLVIDALKLNDIDTIFGLPGIPITDLTRMAQAEGLRVISFRHEQHAGNAAAAAGFLTQKPGICLTVSAPASSTA